jgi:hypothetical protein
MSVDSVARALAIQAQPVDTLATGIGSVSIPAVNKVFRTKGYGALGKGIGLYVADSLANAALAAAHPRFCKLSADGRYWRLSVEDGLNVLAAGAIADNATDDGPAFIAALAYLKAIALTRAPYGFTRGGPKLLIPAGDYYLANSTLDITFGVVIEGDLGGKFWGAGSVLRWADGTTGIRAQASNTTGASADGPETGLNASGTIIRNLYLKGGFSGAESESHGVQLRWPAVLENMTIENFAGDGVFCRCTLGSAPWRGQSNGSAFYNVGVIVCRNGFYFDGFDSNALTFLNCDAHSNRRWGMWCETGIGNTIIGGNFSTNGTFTATPTKCLYSGNWYYCLPNQAAWASVNPPSGTTAHNTGWGYYAAGYAHSDFPAWSSGMAIRDGGTGRFDGVGQSGVIHGLYQEGDQTPLLIEGKYVCTGEAIRTRTFAGANYGGHIKGGPGALLVPAAISSETLQVRLEGTFGGTDAGDPIDGAIVLNSSNAYNFIRFRHLGTLKASIFSYADKLYIDAVAGGVLRENGFDVATFGTAGLLVSHAGAKIGYSAGAGGAVAQATSKSTGVTLNKSCGNITLHNGALAASSSVAFTLTSSAIETGDAVIVNIASGATAGSYLAQVEQVAAGSCRIQLRNVSGGSLSEAVVLNFAVVKAVAA